MTKALPILTSAFILSIIFSQKVTAQNAYNQPGGRGNAPYEVSGPPMFETFASYGNGPAALNNYIERNTQYPAADKEKGTVGIVYLSFTVNKDGSLSGITANKGPSPTMKAEAIRIIKSMPTWKPATIKGKPVKSPYTVSVDFNQDPLLKADQKIYTLTDTPPVFGADMSAFYSYFSANVHYPTEAWSENITGKVYVSFVVEKDGALSNIKFVSAPIMALGDEAIRVVGTSPKWTPGTVDGAPVRSRLTLPFTFELGRQN